MATPLTQVLLKIPKAFQDEIVTQSGVKLFYDGSFKKEWSASVVGTIAALPINPRPQDKEILSQVSVGDEVVVSYQIVYDLEFQGDGGQFTQYTEDNDYVKEFINGRGETIKVYALPKRAGLPGATWVGVYQNKKRELIDGAQGDESEVYRWMSQFPFGKIDNYSFNNFFEFDKQDYWKAYPSDIFAKKIKGHLVAVNNRVICKPIDDDIPAELLPHIHHNTSVKIRRQDQARVLTGGKSKGIHKDDIVSFAPNHVEKYDIGGKQYYLINENLVQGKWN